MPAKAGIQEPRDVAYPENLDSRPRSGRGQAFRGNDNPGVPTLLDAPPSRPDSPFSGPTSFVRLPVHGGHETLVDPDIAEALEGQRLCLVAGPYAGFRRQRRNVFLHHCVVGRPLSGDVDHINRDTLDNRRCNLRIVSRSVNLLNQEQSRHTASGFRGVYAAPQPGRWRPGLEWRGRALRSATLREPLLAAFARDDLVRRVTGMCVGLNFPRTMSRAQAGALLCTSQDAPVTVWFVKRSDGSIRRISCRAEPAVPPARRGRDDALCLVTVRDVDADKPRCIPMEAILCLTWSNQSFRVTDAPRAAA